MHAVYSDGLITKGLFITYGQGYYSYQELFCEYRVRSGIN